MSTEAKAEAVSSSELVRRVHADDLPGWWTKYLAIRPGQQAIVVRKGATTVLAPPGGRIRGFFGWGPDDAAIVEVGEYTLHPAVDSLLSADDQLLEADCLVRITVADPAALYRALGSNRDRLTLGELEARVGGDVRGRLLKTVRQYAGADLCGSTAIAERVAGDLRGYLADSLEPIGLAVEGVGHLSFLPAEDAVRRSEALRQLRERLRQSDTRARLGAIRDEREFADAVRQLEHEYGLRNELRQGEVVGVSADGGAAPSPDGAAQASPAPAGSTDRVATLTRVVDQRLARHHEQLTARFDQLLKRVGYAEPPDPRAATIRRLSLWVLILRNLGTITLLSIPVILLFWPEFFPDDRTPRLISTFTSITLAVITNAWAFWLNRRRCGQQALLQGQRDRERLSPERRAAAEKMVRAKVAGSLDRVASNLQEAQARAYRSGQAPVAAALRELRRATEAFRDEVQGVSYPIAVVQKDKLFVAEDLERLLTIEDGLIEQGEALAATSEALHAQVVEGHHDEAELDRRSLESGLQTLRNRLIERAALLKGV